MILPRRVHQNLTSLENLSRLIRNSFHLDPNVKIHIINNDKQQRSEQNLLNSSQVCRERCICRKMTEKYINTHRKQTEIKILVLYAFLGAHGTKCSN